MNYTTRQMKSLSKNFFSLSYEKRFDADMGLLYPVYIEEALAGDRVKLTNECVVRFQPLVAPVFGTINTKTEYYFVPFRIMFDDWESFLTGGADGTESPELPLWDDYTVPESGAAVTPPKYSLWDYFGLPLVSPPSADDTPLGFARIAYNMIWNKYYRDENVDSEVSLENNDVLRRRWNKDYFTSALPFQQRGVSPSFPLSGVGSTVWDNDVNTSFTMDTSSSYISRGYKAIGITNAGSMEGQSDFIEGSVSSSTSYLWKLRSKKDDLNDNEIDLSGIATFDVKDLRLANQIQIMLEISARGGYRYDEFLLAMFGVAPEDSRIDEPEFLGGSSSPLLVSEVLQTSESTDSSPQGSLAGRGIGLSRNYIAKFTVPEPGLIIGIFSICPVASYASQGVGKMWLRRTRFDFYFPALSHLSEQPVLKKELFLSDDADDNAEVFGYQGIYDEYRHRRDEVCGGMRDTFAYWHLARIFDSSPTLNSSFLQMNPRKDIFAVQNEPGFLVNFRNVASFVRPIPKFATPGMLRF